VTTPRSPQLARAQPRAVCAAGPRGSLSPLAQSVACEASPTAAGVARDAEPLPPWVDVRASGDAGRLACLRTPVTTDGVLWGCGWPRQRHGWNVARLLSPGLLACACTSGAQRVWHAVPVV